MQKAHPDLTAKPLSGVRILDLTQAYSGPFCTMHLADQGAEIIKVEVPNRGDQSRAWAPFEGDASGYYSYINRNKYGITLDLKSEKGKELFKQLAQKVDVVCENFRVGTMENLGLGYETLRELNPKLIYASISGFGLDGELASRPCYDIVAQAMGGLMSVTGLPDNVFKVGTAIADNYSGTYLSLGIVMALFQRERTGLGRRLDVSMLDTVFSILEASVVEYTIRGEIQPPVGNRDPGITPFGQYAASDGMIVVACGTDKFWRALCKVMGDPELAEEPRFADNNLRCENESALRPIIEAWTKQYTMDELETLISSEGIPFGKVLNIKQVCELDAIQRRNMLWNVYDENFGHEITIPGTPIKMHGCTDQPQRGAPTLGMHTDAYLRTLLGMSDEEIRALHESKVI